MIKEIGEMVLKLAETAPDGILVFFPSYNTLDTFSSVWDGYGLTARIEAHKKLFIEGKKAKEFQKMREKFESEIDEGKGAIMMGVCKGKVSEGLDFSDKQARTVIMIGIPYAVFMDPKVILKKKYLNAKCDLAKKKGDTLFRLKGEDWYQQEATRAVNQAIGRVIRHQNDFGLIVMLD